MPVVEHDVLITSVNRADRFHEQANRIFERAAQGGLKNFAITASALVEYELVLRSRGYKEESVKEDLGASSRLKGVRILLLTKETLLKAIKPLIKHRLIYSLHAATALLYDAAIISIDQACRTLEELTVLDPRHI